MFGDPVTNPKSWDKLSLAELSELITKGASPNWQGIEYVDDSTQTLFVTSENVREGYLDLTKTKYLQNEFNEKQKRSVLRKGDFLINIVGASIGRAAQFNLDCTANINQAVALVRVKQGLLNDKYLLTYLNSPKALQMYETMQVSVARANLSLQNISDLEILVPPIELQNQFATFVQQVDKLKFVRFKSQFIEMFGDPFENPKGYVKKTIGDVCDFQGGSQPPRKEFVFKPQEGYVRLIQIRDYKTDDYITYAPEKMCRRFCDADDIMIGRYGPPIFQILQGIEGAYNVALMKAIPHGINKEFMRAYLKRDELLHHLELFSTRTAGQSGIEMSELRGYPCLVPPEEEQLQYVEFVKQSDKSKLKEEDHKSGMHEL